MQRGEVWWALIGERCPVVLLSGGDAPEFRAMQIVAPATAEQKHGFVVLSGQQAADTGALQQAIGSPGAGTRGIGIEVEMGAAEGLTHEGVVRVALAREGQVFCTWLTVLTRESLLEQAGALSPTKLDQLADALRLARIE